MLQTIMPIITLAAFLAANESLHTRTITNTIAFKQNQKVMINHEVGDINILPGCDTLLSVVAKVKVKGKESDLDKIKFSVDRSAEGASITVYWPHKRMKEHITVDLSIKMPARTNMNIVHNVGDIDIENIEGNIEIKLNVGNVTLEYPLSRTITNCRLNVDVGNINLSLPEKISANLRAQCGAGNIESPFPNDLRSGSLDSGDKSSFILGTGRNLFDLNISVGNIVIEKTKRGKCIDNIRE